MNKTYPFLQKEILENIRSGRLLFLLLLFLVFGVMNPALAKLTPWLLKLMAESLAQSGITLGEIEVTAIQSWEQFYKNISTALIVFIIMFSNILANEYNRGTLIPLLAKGLSKTSIYFAKYINVFWTWTLCFWLCFFVTYAYNGFYWGNSGVSNIFIGALLWWLLGILIISLEMFWAIFFQSGTTVILFVGASYFISYLLGLLPRLKNIMPTSLANGLAFLTGNANPRDIVPAIMLTIIICVLLVFASNMAIKKKVI